MAYVVLPSKTAKLVYGYLLKENLNEIASQFLEASPYLRDCSEVVKSGYHFNTKFMSKDLHELLQEYSTIKHIVDNKVSMLLKTSLLYKRVKLKCETLPEIIELILFWRYKSASNNNESSGNVDGEGQNDNNSPNQNQISETSHPQKENTTDCPIEDQNLEQVSTNEEMHPPQEKMEMETIMEYLPVQNKQFINHSNSSSSIYRPDIGENVKATEPVESSGQNLNQNNMQVIFETSEENMQTGNGPPEANTPKSPSQQSDCASDQQNQNDNVPTSSQDSVENEVICNSAALSRELSVDGSSIQILEIKTGNQDGVQHLNVFSKSEEGNISTLDSNVVYLNSADMTLNADQNQIIVIPIDYYKSGGMLFQNDCREVMTNNQTEMTLHVDTNCDSQENNVPYEDAALGPGQPTTLDEDNADAVQKILDSATNDRGMSVTEKTVLEVPSLTAGVSSTTTECYGATTVIRNSTVDSTIITEESYQNQGGELIYNLSSKPAVTYQNVTLLPSNPVIVVQAPVSKNKKYRTILPKKKREKIEINPIIVVHPLLKNNEDLTKTTNETRKNTTESLKEIKKKRAVRKPKIPPPIAEEKSEDQDEQNDTPCTVPPNEKSPEKTDPSPVPETSVAEVETTQNEKENQEKPETTVETPVIFNARNTRRLSLSTPRRKNHIRALDFETPTKTKDDKKKSQTSPKVKVDSINVDRKNVRNTLFKSPDPEIVFKSPNCLKSLKKPSPKPSEPKPPEMIDALSELISPIATRSPRTKLSDTWGELTGVDCVLGNTEKDRDSKKLWDADLRVFVSETNGPDSAEKKRMRKPMKTQQSNKPSSKKKSTSKKSKASSIAASPPKISLTAKRNTYSISENEELSPVRSLEDDLRLETPFKDLETTRPADETPFTKLLRENVSGIDIDLSMINTPSFPPTPSILITPDLKDVSELTDTTGTNYYTPLKEDSRTKVMKITDYFQVESTKKKDTKEIHEKEIQEIVTEAKKIAGLCGDHIEDNVIKKPPTGKILSMVKIQMITQCDKRLCENIPINENPSFLEASASTTETTVIETLGLEVAKQNLKEELEEKRKRALKKLKVVKENLSTQPKSKVAKRPLRKRKRTNSGSPMSEKRVRVDAPNESINESQTNESVESSKEESPVIVHSTPYMHRKRAKFEGSESDASRNASKSDMDKTDNSKDKLKVDNRILDDIRQEFPPFHDNIDHPELMEKSRKKLHYVKHFLKLDEIVKYLNEFDENDPRRLTLKSSFRKFFQVFYKWLKHPHRHELNASDKTKATLKEYLCLFEKINRGLSKKSSRQKDEGTTSRKANLETVFKSYANSEPRTSNENIDGKVGSKWKTVVARRREDGGTKVKEVEVKGKDGEKRKEDEAEDGVECDGIISTLPLKKRKATVQTVDAKVHRIDNVNPEKANVLEDSGTCAAENVTQTQNFLQDIDVDRFLSQIHGRESSYLK